MGSGVANLKVNYELLSWMHGTLSGLAEQDTDDRASAYDAAYGSGDIAAAMGNFSGNWTDHRKALTGTMRSLGQMAGAAAERFHSTDDQLAGELTSR